MPSPQSLSVRAVNASERDTILGTLPQKTVVRRCLCALDFLFQKPCENVPSGLTFDKLPTEWFLPCLRMLGGK